MAEEGRASRRGSRKSTKRQRASTSPPSNESAHTVPASASRYKKTNATDINGYPNQLDMNSEEPEVNVSGTPEGDESATKATIQKELDDLHKERARTMERNVKLEKQIANNMERNAELEKQITAKEAILQRIESQDEKEAKRVQKQIDELNSYLGEVRARISNKKAPDILDRRSVAESDPLPKTKDTISDELPGRTYTIDTKAKAKLLLEHDNRRLITRPCHTATRNIWNESWDA